MIEYWNEFSSLLVGWFEPTSKVYSAFSLAASMGTIWALVLTIKSINEAKEESKLARQITGIEGVFSSLELILTRVVFFQYNGPGDTETHFGRPAFYRSKSRGCAGMNNMENLIHINDYMTNLSVYSSTVSLILSTMQDDHVMNRYYKRLTAEQVFVQAYILPIVQRLKISNEQNSSAEESSKLCNDTLEMIDVLDRTNFSKMIFKSDK